jgi:hypothetical protein
VPVICTQSLRRLHGSVATEAGATSHVVASALGHSSPAVTTSAARLLDRRRDFQARIPSA